MSISNLDALAEHLEDKRVPVCLAHAAISSFLMHNAKEIFHVSDPGHGQLLVCVTIVGQDKGLGLDIPAAIVARIGDEERPRRTSADHAAVRRRRRRRRRRCQPRCPRRRGARSAEPAAPTRPPPNPPSRPPPDRARRQSRSQARHRASHWPTQTCRPPRPGSPTLEPAKVRGFDV